MANEYEVITDINMKRFWSKVRKRRTGCWEWQAYKTLKGYGQFQTKNGHIRAHRFAWILINGTIPKNMIICHKCDNPSCVNPEHLFLGTQQDNIKDMYSKDRGVNNRGENQGASKLTEKHIIQIRRFHKTGRYTQKMLANKFEIDQSTISRIVHKHGWSHV